MASLDELSSALFKADAAGDTDAARAFAGEIRRMRETKPTPTFTPGPEGFRKSLGEAISADAFPAGAQLVAGAGTALDQAALRAKQLFSKLTPQDTQKVEANRMLTDTPLGMAGNVAGQVGMFGALPMATLPKALAGGAALSTATNPVLQGESEIANTVAGGGGAAAGNLVGRGMTRIAQPIMQSPAVKRMLSEGIVPTPGQAAGGMLGRIEQKAESIVGPGDFIRLGRDRAGKEFNSAFMSKGAADGARPTQLGPEGINELKGGLSAAYDKIFAGKTVSPTPALFTAIDDAKNVPVLPLNAESQKSFDAVIERAFKQRIPQSGQLPADEVKKQIIGDIGKAARDLKSSTVASEKALGDALYAARNRVQDWLTVEVGSTSPQAAQQLARIDPAYANMRIAEKAVERGKAAGGQFTPFQAQSVTSPGSQMRGLANDAQSVLGNRVPNSGSIDRAMIAGVLGLGGAGVNEYFGGPGYLSALAAAPLLYSRAGSRYMVGDLPGQQGMRGILSSLQPATTQAGRVLANKFQEP